MSSEGYHEPLEQLSAETRDFHRAITSIIEELEAIDWYNQRAQACADEALREILIHNRNEEVEHAMMGLEWLRRNHEIFRKNIETYIGTSEPITEIEDAANADAARKLAPSESRQRPTELGVGNLRKVKR